MKTKQISDYAAAVDTIKNLYHEMLDTSFSDSAYRSKLAAELFRLQREDGSWSAIDDVHAPADIRVGFVFFPTYYATAALLFRMNRDGLPAEKEMTCLKKGLQIAMQRNLAGSGFTATREQLEALTIYKDAGLYRWMRAYGERFPAFSGMIEGLIAGFRDALSTGRTFSDWDEDFKEEFQKEVSDYEEEMNPEVWYAAYGSNLCLERFMKYIDKCADKTPPKASDTYKFPFNIFFAGRSRTWNGGGTAFLDDSREGFAFGRIYKISRGQLDDIQQMEGANYTRRLLLGEKDDLPIYTFTTENPHLTRNTPSAEYLAVIEKGLAETYPWLSALSLQVYLYSRSILDDNDRKILSCLRSSEHGLSLQELTDRTSCNITTVRASVKKLRMLCLIRQDGRSIRAGSRASDREAVFYTQKDMRELIDILLVI
ncbi:MAG: HTH domain-containing protein [Lachnospiraceae bacterium]|nr:HTH domain-containing protein [Lachnospiraceae bacterium]